MVLTENHRFQIKSIFFKQLAESLPIKESVRAKLKVIVKRVLRQYGYPPDMQMLAAETVLKQAEMIAEELTKDNDTAVSAHTSI